MPPVVAIALSGGIDSLVAAFLLKRSACRLLGLHFSTVAPGDASRAYHARLAAMAAQLGIPLEICDLAAPFRQAVISPFVAAYARGLTPNPCLRCNDKIKFGLLLEHARARGADLLATGHYARLDCNDGGQPILRQGCDLRKDQSYFLARLGPQQLARARFPLGEMTKQAVVALAESHGLTPVVGRESQDVCFIREGRCGDFLQQVGGLEPRPGPIVDLAGKVLGQHAGLFRYTVGQRRGLGCPAARPYYVVRLDPAANRVVVGFLGDLERGGCSIADVSWTGEPPTEPIDVAVRLRYRSPAVSAILYPSGATAFIRFQQPQRAVAPGQGAVFYQGDRVLGSGWIEPEP